MMTVEIWTSYFFGFVIRIEAVTPNGSGGPVARLKTFLEVSVCLLTFAIILEKSNVNGFFFLFIKKFIINDSYLW